ncbi:sugar transporter [Nitzschia inconspicua]|uniref:Sugar transporter n=1 Tax=Nitzschia inconspicua TaxID=303405 RepID=A0A9K3L4D9_9STRA|nr:sugar transporter [Nitzschia inconspicua]
MKTSTMRCASFFLLATTAVLNPVAAFGMKHAKATTTTTLQSISNPNSDMNHRNSHYRRQQHVTPPSSFRRMTRPVRTSSSTQLSIANINQFRGGADIVSNSVATFFQGAKQWNASPTSLFNTSFVAVAMLTAVFKILQRISDYNSKNNESTKSTEVTTPGRIKELQIKFLSVFWLLRCADWLQGPYFYEVYASKVFNGVPASIALISRLFLTGFASTAVFGPLVGRAVDLYGRKSGTIAFSLIYAVGALSTKSPLLLVLFLGRVFSGIGTSLLFSAPESWLVAEAQKDGEDPDGKYLGETFGLAYAGDSIVAILAGQLAGIAASQKGPTGPFELSTVFLAAGGLLAAFLWGENKATEDGSASSGKPSIKDAIQVVKNDPKIMLVGGVQSLFEAAMYIFVLQWPPAISKAVTKAFGESSVTPYGAVFSCFMACCLFGSTLFGQLAKIGVSTEAFTLGMLSVGTLAMSLAAFTVSSAVSMSLPLLVASFFAFEACVGIYFPCIGTLRSKYVPDSHRSVIMNLFGIPLNVLVVGVFLSISKLGLSGALKISAGALATATLFMLKLVMSIRAPNGENQAAVDSIP